MASKPGSDFNYAYYLPKKPPIAMYEAEREVKCPCGVTFIARSRNKHRCDACQAIRNAQVTARSNEKLKAKRKAARQCQA